ncbi:MAG: CocE/NonD family hydrolase [Bacteroidetes bacterium]|nr:CocE/NonD family hydrolase [Bacteroidota bacterium]
MQKFFLFILVLIGFYSTALSQIPDSVYIKNHYDKIEVSIPMRDGIKLFTSIYTPKDKSKTYPILMQRTCYSVAPYGTNKFRRNLGPSKYLMKDGYIFVYQDVRGRWMSEGIFDNMRPNIPGNDLKNKTAIDESSDTWDTIDWLIKNTKGNNGRVGQWGISYPGHYTAAGIPDAHPALKASSPQAPISDFFFDDFHHQGAYLQSYTAAFAVFGYQHEKPTDKDWYMDKIGRFYSNPAKDGYDFNLRLGPLKNITEKYHFDNFFWQQIIDHPNYDEFWQKRNILPHLTNVKHAVMTVGGWFDAEDLFGPLNIYKKIEGSSATYNTIVMGPWSHGDWARETGFQQVNHIYFGDSISTFYQREIERKFFNSFLKESSQPALPEAYMYDCGLKTWKQFAEWPPKDIPPVKLYFAKNGELSINTPTQAEAVFDYVSDPLKPVPYTSQTEGLVFTPRRFMSDDQREASRRPDVLTFQTEPLTEDITLAGEIAAKLKVSLSSDDADFIVKIIDVYPDNTPNDTKHNPPNIIMGGYQQLIRSEVFRARFRNSFEKPEPFTPNQITDVNFALQDLFHTIKKGHRLMVQIHSTWFPYIDRNPQKYVDNIYKANEEDFIKQTIKVYGSSVVEIGGGEKLKAKIEKKK